MSEYCFCGGGRPHTPHPGYVKVVTPDRYIEVGWVLDARRPEMWTVTEIEETPVGRRIITETMTLECVTGASHMVTMTVKAA